MTNRTDIVARLIHAPPETLYGAFIDSKALMQWLPPEGMSGRALLFEPWEGGRYRIELSYDDGAQGSGKTNAKSDISAGRFLKLEPGRRIIISVEFESADPAFAGEMLMTWLFEPASQDGTNVTITVENVPTGISAEDHAAGLASTLENLARFAASR